MESLGLPQRCSNLSLTRDYGPFQSRPQRKSRGKYKNLAAAETDLAGFPQNYVAVVRDAREAAQAALNDGRKLLEVEFPTSSLAAVAETATSTKQCHREPSMMAGPPVVTGDDDGVAEMNSSLGHLRSFCQPFQTKASSTRIFFPDANELRVAREGKAMDPAAGSAKLDPIFDQSNFRLDYLTNPNLLSDFGITLGQPDVLDRIRDSDDLYICAYPYFNVSEMLAVERLYEKSTAQSGKPIIVFNGELDRIRSGYYMPFFYPKISQLATTFICDFTTVYYLHNFKGSKGGALYRVYPGPWQVLRRYGDGSMQVVHTQDEMPTLKEVALTLLPNS